MISIIDTLDVELFRLMLVEKLFSLSFQLFLVMIQRLAEKILKIVLIELIGLIRKVN